ncbi:MAG: FG-GAP-like repeat-containing protein [Tepidisphaeraceae bacterium]
MLPVARLSLVLVALLLSSPTLAAPRDGWPEPRQNAHLTAMQPLGAAMKAAPTLFAEHDFGRSAMALTWFGDKGLAIVAGAVKCYDARGTLLWTSHPPGLNFTNLIRCDDFDGDGAAEIALQAGRPAEPFGAAVLLSLADGQLRWRYDVEPMSYSWTLHLVGRQLVVLMQGYPPEPQNGYIAVFHFPSPGQPPKQRWRYDFDRDTCFPTLLTTDLDGHDIEEIAVETHSRMWLFDAASGAVKQTIEWDVAPANIRSYGLADFVDLNGDGREDFLCIANFAQHHEVLLNENGKLKKAWHHGWPESVTTGTVSTTYPLPAHGDVDGDGRIEIVLSMFNSENERGWMTRVYDAATGKLKHRLPGVIATTLVDADGDGAAEVFADPCTDPAVWRPDGSHVPSPNAGVRAIKLAGGEPLVVWQDADALAIRSAAANRPHITRGGEAFVLSGLKLQPVTQPAAATHIRPLIAAAPTPELLAADVLGIGRNQLITYAGGRVVIFRLDGQRLTEVKRYDSAALPVIADFDGDGSDDLALCDADPSRQPGVRVVSPSQGDNPLWSMTFPPPAKPSLPKPRVAYLRAAHFAGRATPDLYCWFGTPSVRSAAIDGRGGQILWETGELPGLERYAAPTQNLASTFDVNTDGREDLVFTAPDFYCVASGVDGKLLVGPTSPQTIFQQPSQGLYTLPAILPSPAGEPVVALVAGHYFQAAMSISGKPMWHQLPPVGEARTAAEGFARTRDGAWLMGFGRQNGKFACLNISDGSLRWELDVQARTTDAISCDIDADGAADFVFATSHAKLYAIADGGSSPRVLWTVDLPAPAAGSPIAADLTGDGTSEVIVATADGRVLMFN